MFDKSILEGFTLVPIKDRTTKRGIISIDKQIHKFTISSVYGDQLGWTHGQRLDLRQNEGGTTFALIPNKVGLVTANKMNKSNTFVICSSDMCHKIKAFTFGCTRFEGWVAEGILFFKPMEGDE